MVSCYNLMPYVVVPIVAGVVMSFACWLFLCSLRILLPYFVLFRRRRGSTEVTRSFRVSLIRKLIIIINS